MGRGGLTKNEQSLSELKRIILRTIHVRRVTLAVFLGIALLLRFGAGFAFPLPLIFSPLMWGLMTYPFAWLIKTREGVDTLNNIHFGFFVLEVLILTYLIHIIGGVEWIGIAYYLFSVIYANFFLPTKMAWTVTFLAIVLFSAMSFAEYFQLIPHWSVFKEEGELYKNFFYVSTTILAGGFGIYFTTAYTVQIFARLFRDKNRSLQDREEELQLMWKKLISAREEERARMAKRLHDELGQTLTGVKMKLDILNRELDREELDEASSLLGEAIEESRGISHHLRPSLLDELGLGAALEEMVKNYRSSGDVNIESSIDDTFEVEGRDKRTILYRAAQELVNNAHKHAQADRIELSLRKIGDKLRLEVIDDGVGFDPGSVSKRSGLGLKGIEENVTAAGGQFKLFSRPGEGTEAAVELSLE